MLTLNTLNFLNIIIQGILLEHQDDNLSWSANTEQYGACQTTRICMLEWLYTGGKGSSRIRVKIKDLTNQYLIVHVLQ